MSPPAKMVARTLSAYVSEVAAMRRAPTKMPAGMWFRCRTGCAPAPAFKTLSPSLLQPCLQVLTTNPMCQHAQHELHLCLTFNRLMGQVTSMHPKSYGIDALLYMDRQPYSSYC